LLRIRVGNLAIDKFQPENIRYPYPLLFIHGAGGTSEYLRNYLLFFSHAGWRTYAVNLRGHYPSDREAALARVTIEDYIEDVERVIRILGLTDCALIGHSMGGLIAQRTAMHVKTAKALVAIASAPPQGVTLELQRNLPDSGTLLKSVWGMMNMKPVKATYFMAEKTLLNNIEEKERKNIFPMFVAESLVVGYQVAQGVFVDPDKIRCPKLVIGCRKDAMALITMQEKLAKFLDADFISYRQFAHLPMLEKGWERSARDIATWLINNVKV
jgi:pimeloyl-ACP methyl ester carboxylesterase